MNFLSPVIVPAPMDVGVTMPIPSTPSTPILDDMDSSVTVTTIVLPSDTNGDEMTDDASTSTPKPAAADDMDATAFTQALTQVTQPTHITINMSSERRITMDVSPHDTIQSIKQKLYALEGTIPTTLTIHDTGVILEDDKMVSDYQLGSGMIDATTSTSTSTSTNEVKKDDIPIDNTWRTTLTIDSKLDILDHVNQWYTGRVIAYDDTPVGYIAITYDGWGSEWNELMEISNLRLAPLLTKARGNRSVGGVYDRSIVIGHHTPQPTWINRNKHQKILPSAPKSPKSPKKAKVTPSSPRARARSPTPPTPKTPRAHSPTPKPPRTQTSTPTITPITTTTSTLPRNTVYLYDVPIPLTNADLNSMMSLLETPVSTTTINMDHVDDSHHLTLAHWACIYDRVDVLTMIQSRGLDASFHVSHSDYGTPMHIACRYGSESCIHYLLSLHIPFHIHTQTDRSLPLHYAMKQSNGGCSRLLVAAYEQDDSKHQDNYLENRMGETPLHAAVGVMSVDNITLACTSSLFPYMNRPNDVLQLPSYYRKYATHASHDVVDAMLDMIKRTQNAIKKKRTIPTHDTSDSDSDESVQLTKRQRISRSRSRSPARATRSRSRSRSASPSMRTISIPSMRDVKKRSPSPRRTIRELVTPPLSPGMSTRTTDRSADMIDTHTTRSGHVFSSRVVIHDGSNVTTITASSKTQKGVDRVMKQALKNHKKKSATQSLVARVTRSTSTPTKQPAKRSPSPSSTVRPSSPALNTRSHDRPTTRSRSRSPRR